MFRWIRNTFNSKPKRIEQDRLDKAVEELQMIYDKLDEAIWIISQLKIEEEVFAGQIKDFATKAEFSVHSLLSTVKLAYQAKQERQNSDKK